MEKKKKNLEKKEKIEERNKTKIEKKARKKKEKTVDNNKLVHTSENEDLPNPYSKIDENVEKKSNECKVETVKPESTSPAKSNSTSIPFSRSDVTISDFCVRLSSNLSLSTQTLKRNPYEPNGDPSSESTTSLQHEKWTSVAPD